MSKPYKVTVVLRPPAPGEPFKGHETMWTAEASGPWYDDSNPTEFGRTAADAVLNLIREMEKVKAAIEEWIRNPVSTCREAK